MPSGPLKDPLRWKGELSTNSISTLDVLSFLQSGNLCEYAGLRFGFRGEQTSDFLVDATQTSIHDSALDVESGRLKRGKDSEGDGTKTVHLTDELDFRSRDAESRV